MAFKLRSSSPVLQEKKPSANALKEFQDKKFGKQKGYAEVPMLSPEGKTEYKLLKGNKDITGSKEFQKYKTNQKMENLENRQDYEAKNKADILMADPTGISSWGDAKRGLQHIGFMAETGNWKKGRLLKDALDIVSAVPLGSKVKAAKAGLDVVKKAGTRTPKLFKAAEAAKNAKLTTAAAIVSGDKMSEAISNKNMTDKNKKSPAMQKKTKVVSAKKKVGMGARRSSKSNVS